MALIKCKSCGAEISDAAQLCPHCGAPNTSKKMTNSFDSLNSIQGKLFVNNGTFKENNVLGLMSAMLSGLYLIFHAGMNIASNVILRYSYYDDPERISTWNTTWDIVTCILLLGIICTWIISYKKENSQTPRMISTVLIAISPIINIILGYIFRIM